MTTPKSIQRLVEQLRNSQRSVRERLPVTPGVYGLFVQAYDGSAENPSYIDEWELFYIGMTADGSGARDHFAYSHSGLSSPRRSLGALLKDKLKLRAIPRGRGKSKNDFANYRLEPQGELALTRWMYEHVKVSHVPVAEGKQQIHDIEKRLIALLKPPLNLRGKPRCRRCLHPIGMRPSALSSSSRRISAIARRAPPMRMLCQSLRPGASAASSRNCATRSPCTSTPTSNLCRAVCRRRRSSNIWRIFACCSTGWWSVTCQVARPSKRAQCATLTASKEALRNQVLPPS
jgi:hypothetical protein